MPVSPVRRANVRAVPFFLLLLLVALTPGAAAHAVLQSATPPPNGHGDAGLTQIDLKFTEDLEHQYTNARIEDANGAILPNTTFRFDDAQKSVVHLDVPPLGDGIYTVFWQALSVDSHTTQGAFAFAVGNASIKFPIDVVTSSAGNTVPEGFARAGFYLGLFVVIGIPVFLFAVSRNSDLPARPFATAGLLGLLGAASALLGLLFLSSRTGIAFATATTTGAGRSFAWRAGLLALAGAASLAAFFVKPTARRALAWAAIALGAGSLLATSLGSHAAADSLYPDVSIGLDALHLVMGAIWIGGIVAFLHAVWGRDAREVGTLVERFTPLAIASVVALLATGSYASVRHLTQVSDLWTQPYGRLVALKLGLMGPLIAIGAYNKQLLGPRLRSGTGSPRFFRRVMQVEAVLMVVILGAAGVLASTPPPDQGVQAGLSTPSPIHEDSKFTKFSHVIIDIRPNPVTVGVQNLSISVHPLTRVPTNANTSVYFSVAPANQPEPDVYWRTDLKRVTNDTWQIQDGLFSSAGPWKLYVTLQRTDVPEFAKLTFDVDVVLPK